MNSVRCEHKKGRGHAPAYLGAEPGAGSGATPKLSCPRGASAPRPLRVINTEHGAANELNDLVVLAVWHTFFWHTPLSCQAACRAHVSLRMPALSAATTSVQQIANALDSLLEGRFKHKLPKEVKKEMKRRRKELEQQQQGEQEQARGKGKGKSGHSSSDGEGSREEQREECSDSDGDSGSKKRNKKDKKDKKKSKKKKQKVEAGEDGDSSGGEQGGRGVGGAAAAAAAGCSSGGGGGGGGGTTCQGWWGDGHDNSFRFFARVAPGTAVVMEATGAWVSFGWGQEE